MVLSQVGYVQTWSFVLQINFMSSETRPNVKPENVSGQLKRSLENPKTTNNIKK